MRAPAGPRHPPVSCPCAHRASALADNMHSEVCFPWSMMGPSPTSELPLPKMSKRTSNLLLGIAARVGLLRLLLRCPRLQQQSHCTPLPPHLRLLIALHDAPGSFTPVPCAVRFAGAPAATPAVPNGPSSSAAPPPPPPLSAAPARDGGEAGPAASQDVPPPPPPATEAAAASAAEGTSTAAPPQASTQAPASAAAASHPSAPATNSAATAVGAGAGPPAAGGTQAANGAAPAAVGLPNGLALNSRATGATRFPTRLGHDSDGVNGLGAGGPVSDTGAAFLLQVTEEPLPTPQDNGMAVGDEEMAQASTWARPCVHACVELPQARGKPLASALCCQLPGVILFLPLLLQWLPWGVQKAVRFSVMAPAWQCCNDSGSNAAPAAPVSAISIC